MQRLRIGLVFELFGSYPRRPEDPADADAEYEPAETIELLEAAIRRLGHTPLRLGTPLELLERAGKARAAPGPLADAALSIAEGRDTRDREAWGSVLLEMLEIPQLGSDALTRSLSLDKAWTKAVAAAAGVPVAPHASVASAREAATIELPASFPLFVKPRWEGSAKGIGPSSRVESRTELVREVERIVRLYRQPALIEPLLPGPEYTVAVIGNDPPRALPVLQRALEGGTRIGLHALERHPAPPGRGPWAACLPGSLEPALEARLAELALRAFRALECRDFARVDFKLDEKGKPYLLEVNPLPTFAPDGTFGILAELEGRAAEELVAEALAAGLRRLGLMR